MLRLSCIRPMAHSCAALALALAAGCATAPPNGEFVGQVVGLDAVVEESARVSTSEVFPELAGGREGPAAPATVEAADAPAAGGAFAPVGPDEVVEFSADSLVRAPAQFAMDPRQLEYRIGPGDILELQVYADSVQTRQVPVRYDGYISVPEIPDVYVNNATREQATERIRQAYTTRFREPEVFVGIANVQSKFYYVMGDVNRPSQYEYTRPVTLLEAINLAGGQRLSQGGREYGTDAFIGELGQLTKALIIRHVEGEREVMEFDLRGLAQPGPHMGDVPVYPNDVVYVPEGVNLVYVIGEVRQARVFPMSEGMTLLQLLVRAGGPNFSTARMRHVLLIRDVDEDTKEVMVINLRRVLRTGISPEMQPGDILYVPRSRVLELHDFLGRFTRYTGLLSPVMSLYQQAYATYYTREQYDRIYGDDRRGVGADSLLFQQNLQDLLNLLSTQAPPVVQP